MRTLAFAIAFSVVLTCAQSAMQQSNADSPVLLPRDDAQSDSDFLAHRSRLLDVIARRDVAALIASTESRDLRARFDLLNRVSTTKGTDWQHLDRLLRLGGTFTTSRGAQPGRREFCAPYVYSTYPSYPPDELQGERDPWVIVARDVPIRADRSPDAPVLKSFSFSLVKAADGPSGPDQSTSLAWARLEFDHDKWGWVLWDQIRDPEDYHACFAKVDGRWLITAYKKGRPPQDGL